MIGCLFGCISASDASTPTAEASSRDFLSSESTA